MREPSSSKSRVEVDARCRRERYLSSHFGGKGLEPMIEPLDLMFGNAVHNSISRYYHDPALAGHVARNLVQDWAKKNLIQDPVRIEYPILAEALVFGYLHHVFPQVVEWFDVVGVEMRGEYLDPLTKVRWRARPDLLLRHRTDGSVWYVEFKTFGTDPESFTRMWTRKGQLHLGALVLREQGMEVEGVIVQGFHKGGKYKGNLRSRMIGGYRREAPSAVGRTTYRTDWAKGFEWFLATEHPEGVQGWVASLPDAVIAETFPVTPPIVPNPKWMEEFLESKGVREVEIVEGLDRIEQHPEELDTTLRKVFPRNEDACEDAVRHTKCTYYEACWNSPVRRDPLGSGIYKLRVYKEGIEVE